MARKFGLWAAIFSTVAVLSVWLVPAESYFQNAVVAAGSCSLTAVAYFLIEAADRGQQVRSLVIWFSVTLTLGVLYGALLVGGRDARIADLEAAAGATVTVTISPSSQPTGNAPATTPIGKNPTSAPPAPTSSTPTETPTLAGFDPSEVDVRTGGTTALKLGEYGLQIERRWADSDGYGGTLSGENSDIVFREAGMSGREGTQFALLRTGAKRSFPTCKAEKSWLPSLGWNQLAKGTFVCLKTPSGRRGLLRVDEVPNLDDDKPWVQVTGVTWTPIVDR